LKPFQALSGDIMHDILMATAFAHEDPYHTALHGTWYHCTALPAKAVPCFR
jgi:hypothetical protein